LPFVVVSARPSVPAAIAPAAPRHARQADELTDEWEHRFLELRAARHRAGDTNAQPKSSSAAAQKSGAEALSSPQRRNLLPPIRGVDRRRHCLSSPTALGRRNRRWWPRSQNRYWMTATPKRFAYRCLPMVIANQSGWLILNRHKIAVTWNGGVEPPALKIDSSRARIRAWPSASSGPAFSRS
jgi:uncharacterized protein DUF6065